MRKLIIGFTSIELLIVVGIIAAFSGVIYFIYDSVSDKRQVLAEIDNISTLLNKLSNATIASSYQNIQKDNLIDYGIVYNSEFNSFEVFGNDPKSLEFKYKDMNARQCSDFSLNLARFKGQYLLEIRINGKKVKYSPTEIAAECSKGLNDINLTFSNLSTQQVAMVQPGLPRIPPQYAEPGNFVPELPHSGIAGSVPDMSNAQKFVSIPIAPVKGVYVPPVGITDNPNVVVGGDIFDTGGYVKPIYEDNPPPAVTSGEDDLEFKPPVPKPPPPPPPPQPVVTPSTPWASYFFGTFRIYIPNNIDVNVFIRPSGTVSGSGLNEWCAKSNGVTTLPTNHKCPADYSYIGARITLDGSVVWNGTFNTTWRANIGGASNPLQATGSSNGSYITGAFISNAGVRTSFIAYRISDSY